MHVYKFFEITGLSCFNPYVARMMDHRYVGRKKLEIISNRKLCMDILLLYNHTF